ncbi:MAG TPA: NUDIX domain-containing protein [Candidatus Saccharimonadales bacterium]
MERRIAVRAIILHSDKLLAVRLKQYKGSLSIDSGTYWCTPGGGLDPGETLTEGLRREVVEELGVEPEIGSLLFVQQFSHKGREHLEFFFHVTNNDDFQQLDLSKTTHGGIEIAEVAFINPHGANLLPKFLTEESLSGVTAHTQPAKTFAYL